MEYFITEKDGRKRKAELYICRVCGKNFLRRTITSNNKKSECCSKKCSNILRQNRKELTCFQCKKKFWRVLSSIKNSRHGYYFCSRKCKEKAQSLDGTCLDIRPLHYKNGVASYIKRAFSKLLNKCVSCGEDKKYLLIVHHKDGNRNNPFLDNLEIVCHNCHCKRHLRLNKKRELVFDTKCLTPLEELKVLDIS